MVLAYHSHPASTLKTLKLLGYAPSKSGSLAVNKWATRSTNATSEARNEERRVWRLSGVELVSAYPPIH